MPEEDEKSADDDVNVRRGEDKEQSSRVQDSGTAAS